MNLFNMHRNPNQHQLDLFGAQNLNKKRKRPSIFPKFKLKRRHRNQNNQNLEHPRIAVKTMDLLTLTPDVEIIDLEITTMADTDLEEEIMHLVTMVDTDPEGEITPQDEITTMVDTDLEGEIMHLVTMADTDLEEEIMHLVTMADTDLEVEIMHLVGIMDLDVTKTSRSHSELHHQPLFQTTWS